MAKINTLILPSWHIQMLQAPAMSTGSDSQTPFTEQRASNLWHKARALSQFLELRCELSMPKKRQRLDHALSGSTSVARATMDVIFMASATSPAAPVVCKSLPTTLDWDRTNAQTGGLLDWSMDELQDNWQLEVQPVARTVRGKLTRDEAVVIFVACRYVPFPCLCFFSHAAPVSSCRPCACPNEG